MLVGNRHIPAWNEIEDIIASLKKFKNSRLCVKHKRQSNVICEYEVLLEDREKGKQLGT